MTKILIASNNKYGNTKSAVETIAEGMKDFEGIKISVASAKKTDASQIAGYDVLVLGAPNHMANPSRTMMKFIDRLTELDLEADSAAVFGTYSGRLREPDRDVRKMEKKLKENSPKINLISPSLSTNLV